MTSRPLVVVVHLGPVTASLSLSLLLCEARRTMSPADRAALLGDREDRFRPGARTGPAGQLLTPEGCGSSLPGPGLPVD